MKTAQNQQYNGSTAGKQAGPRPDLCGFWGIRKGNDECCASPSRRLPCCLLGALLLASGAVAQELTAAQRDACMADYEKFCKGTVPGGGRIIACLAKESDKLTPACKKVLADAQKK